MSRRATACVAFVVGLLAPVAAAAGPVGSEREVEPDAALVSLHEEAGGAYRVVWDPFLVGGLTARPYDAAGQPTGPDVVFAGSPFAADVERDGAGNFVVVRTASDGYSTGVFGERFDAAGAVITPTYLVNTYTGGGQDLPDVGVMSSGESLVAWHGHVGALGGFDDVYAQRYDASGAPAGPEFLVNAATSNNVSLRPSVIADGAGNWVVAWSATSPNGVFARRYDAAGTPLAPPFQVNSYTTVFAAAPTLVPDGTGGFLVLWSGAGTGDTQGVFARRYDATGSAVGSDFQVNTYTTGPQTTPSADFAGGGEFIIVWQYSGPAPGAAIQARRYDSAGVPLGPEFHVSTYGGSSPRAVIHPSGDFTVIWTNSLGVRSQSFDASGAPVPGDVLISGKRLAMRDRSTPERRALTFTSTDDEAANGINALVTPDVQGAHLHVYNPTTGDSACFPLPAAGWIHAGDLDDPFFYQDPQLQYGPCKTARLTRNGRISARCGGAGIPYTLDEPAQGAVVVSLTLGTGSYCTVFDGLAVRRDGDGRFVARNAAAPAACPTPPVSCP